MNTDSNQSGAKRTIIVSQHGDGNYQTIEAAIDAAEPNDKILVKPGWYRQKKPILVDKPLDIMGDGDIADITIETSGVRGIVITASHGTLANFAIQWQAERSEDGYPATVGVEILKGNIKIDNCKISIIDAERSAAISIKGNTTAPVLYRCVIAAGNAATGIYVDSGAHPTVAECDISGTEDGVDVRGGIAQFTRCNIHCDAFGVTVCAEGRGILKDCNISGRDHYGIGLQNSGYLRAVNCKVSGSKHGVMMKTSGSGEFVNCDLTGNSKGSWQIEDGCQVQKQGNKEENVGFLQGLFRR